MDQSRKLELLKAFTTPAGEDPRAVLQHIFYQGGLLYAVNAGRLAARVQGDPGDPVKLPDDAMIPPNAAAVFASHHANREAALNTGQSYEGYNWNKCQILVDLLGLDLDAIKEAALMVCPEPEIAAGEAV